MRVSATVILAVALQVFATVERVSGAHFRVIKRCPPNTREVFGRCRKLIDDFESFKSDDPDDRPAAAPVVQCDCVPFYSCRTQDVVDMKITKSCKPTEVCCKRGQPTEEGCGWGAGGEEDATEARLGEFPWMVAILNMRAQGIWTQEEYIGGGSIIHPRVVLTAAHKVLGKETTMLKCRAGQLSRTEPESPQDRLVESLMTHPSYERKYTANDVTLIRLTQRFNISQPAVRPLCVGRGPPPRPDLCVTMGWGRKEFNSSEYADKLKKVGAALVPRGVCWRALQAVAAERRGAAGGRGPLHASLLCAGGRERQDACAGDGGAPLVCQIDKANASGVRYAAYGLVAWGVGCGLDGAPGVYVHVSMLHDWIIATLNFLTNRD